MRDGSHHHQQVVRRRKLHGHPDEDVMLEPLRKRWPSAGDDSTTVTSATVTETSTTTPMQTITSTVPTDASTGAITTTSPDAATVTTVGTGTGGVTIVIVFSTPTPSPSDTLSLNGTSLPANATIPSFNMTSTISPNTTMPSTTVLPPTSSSPTTSVFSTGTAAAATGAVNTNQDDGLGTGAVVGIAVASTAAGLALLALLVFWLRGKGASNRRESTMDMMAPSSYPDPYAPSFAGAHNMPSSFGRFEDDDDEPLRGGPGDGDTMTDVSRRRSARSYNGTTY